MNDDVIDDDENDREARELATTRIQAIARGNRVRKKKHPEKVAAATNNPRRRPRNNRGHGEGGRNSAANGTGHGGTVPEGTAGGDPSTVSGSGKVAGGAPAASAATATSSSAAGGGEGGGGASGETVGIDERTVTLIASLVDERITVRKGSSLVHAAHVSSAV